MAPAGVHDNAQAYEKPEVFAMGGLPGGARYESGQSLSVVIAGLDPAIHEAVRPGRQYCFARCTSSWMRGLNPRMTNESSRPAEESYRPADCTSSSRSLKRWILPVAVRGS
jgi:hypothetical protein